MQSTIRFVLPTGLAETSKLGLTTVKHCEGSPGGSYDGRTTQVLYVGVLVSLTIIWQILLMLYVYYKLAPPVKSE